MQMMLPEAGFSAREVERILGLSPKYSYKLIKSGKLEGQCLESCGFGFSTASRASIVR
jgi:hypothetical protein